MSILMPYVEEPATVAGPSPAKQPIVKVAQRIVNAGVRVSDVLNELVQFFGVAVSRN